MSVSGDGDLNFGDIPVGSGEVSTLFGVNQAVGESSVILKRGGQPYPPTDLGGIRPLSDRPDFQNRVTPDETATVTKALQAFYGFSPDELQSWQSALLTGGFYADKYYAANASAPSLGAYDDDSFAAYKKAVVQAARSGKSLTEVLTSASGSGVAKKKQTVSTRLPFSPTRPNPDDIRKVVQHSAREIFGKAADDGLVDKIVSGYQAASLAAQETAYDTNINGGVTNQIPTPETYAATQLQQSNPAGAAAGDAVGVYQHFLDLWNGRQ